MCRLCVVELPVLIAVLLNRCCGDMLMYTMSLCSPTLNLQVGCSRFSREALPGHSLVLQR